MSRVDGSVEYEFAPELEEVASQIAAEDFAQRELATRWAGHLADPEVDGARCCWSADEALAAHKAWVQRMLRIDFRNKEALLQLLVMHFDGAELVWACDVLLESRSASAAAVIRFLHIRRRLPVSPVVARFLERLPVEASNLQAAANAIEYLADRSLERELATDKLVAFAALSDTADPSRVDDFVRFAQLALDSFPDHALRLVRRALRMPSRSVVQDVAAALVALDLPWCARELDAAFREPAPHADDLREALGLLRDRPPDVLRFIGQSAIATRAAWFRDRWPRWYPPDFGDGGAE